MKTLIYFKLTSLNTLKQKYKTEIIYHNQSKLSNLNWIFVYVLKFAFESIKFPSCKRSSCVPGKARNCCRTRHYGSYEDVIILVQWHHNDPCIRIVVSVIMVCFSECAAHHVIIDLYTECSFAMIATIDGPCQHVDTCDRCWKHPTVFVVTPANIGLDDIKD